MCSSEVIIEGGGEEDIKEDSKYKIAEDSRKLQRSAEVIVLGSYYKEYCVTSEHC